MLLRPVGDDFRTIGYYMGRVFLVVALAGVVPVLWALVGREWAPLGSFVLMGAAYALLGVALIRNIPRPPKLDWSHGMVVVALIWLVVPLVATIPFMLSGHFVGPFDAYFDAMSGLSTTGLSVIQDVDHLASSLNLWRLMLQFLGGQGIILAALSLVAAGGAVTLYLGEAREDRFLPSVRSTARFIWRVAIAHLIVAVIALGLIAWLVLGYRPHRAFFHALMVFFGAFDTGGFSPQSTSLGYYHSVIFESAAAVLMVAGALSFGLHFTLWRGRPRAVLANLETRTYATTFTFTLMLALVGLAATGLFTDVAGLTRQGFFQMVSAHTGTGFSTMDLGSWTGLAFGGIAVAMALGGMASSTAGGVKSLRIGLTIKALTTRIKEMLLPEGAVVGHAYYQSEKRRLTPDLAQSVMVASLLFVGLYLVGAGVGLAYGLPLEDALFESVSASANVGLSVGVTDASMPLPLQMVYVLQMWAGRLEFVAVFALVGFAYAWVRGR